MTIREITDGILAGLYEEFGDGYTLYDQTVEQDLREPAFFVQCLTSSRELKLSRVYDKSVSFAVQYFPKVQNNVIECAAVSERLYDALEDITVNGRIIHAQNMESTFSDGIVTFTATYTATILKEEATDTMDDYTETVSIQ